MKIIEWIKAMWMKLTVHTVSNLDRLAFEIEKIKSTLKSSEDAYYLSKGKEKALMDRIAEMEDYKVKLIKGAKRLISEGNDDSLLMRIKSEIESLDRNLKEINKNLELSKTITVKLYEQKNLLSSKLADSKLKLENLKIKDEFSKEVKSFASVIGSETFKSEFDEIAREIETDYNANEFRLVDINIEQDVQSVVNSDNKQSLEDFKNMIMGE